MLCDGKSGRLAVSRGIQIVVVRAKKTCHPSGLPKSNGGVQRLRSNLKMCWRNNYPYTDKGCMPSAGEFSAQNYRIVVRL